ncbi:MAG TPA: phosphodiester glycosidase family protein [Thermoleophilaceae bacterium]|nr:phosphodiester glycosidase family protein [Thermoleophilaceae bacterium]
MRGRLSILIALVVVAAPAPAAAVEVAPGVQWTTVVKSPGPTRINVLEIDPARVRGVLSNETIARRERVSAMGRRVGAVAGVNGGYFATSGDPVGVLALNGQLLSEPVDGRSALIVDSGGASIAPVRFRGRIALNGRSRGIDGVDRTRGLIPACGGRGGDVPTSRPNSALTCTDASELVLLSPRYGARPPAEGGVEALLRGGTVADVRPPGSGRVPLDGLLLTGSGDGARFLRDAALPRSRATLAFRLTAAGRSLPLVPGTAPPTGGVPGPLAAGPELVVGGGPLLVRAGRVAVTAAAEGFAPPQAPAFFRAFVAGRQPRTLGGVRADGTLLLVTVDGRRPGWSVGMTLAEAARYMRSLGARDALNLDGGGSTTMTVRGELVNRPSDPTGERPVSDGIFALP